jgi:hypothetical protein
MQKLALQLTAPVLMPEKLIGITQQVGLRSWTNFNVQEQQGWWDLKMLLLTVQKNHFFPI